MNMAAKYPSSDIEAAFNENKSIMLMCIFRFRSKPIPNKNSYVMFTSLYAGVQRNVFYNLMYYSESHSTHLEVHEEATPSTID